MKYIHILFRTSLETMSDFTLLGSGLNHEMYQSPKHSSPKVKGGRAG